ncbi:hypothetical protein PVAND_000642 [Polypedilum vanderplanki]|uniref:Aminopeptidase n=1 Tax=Polypedilum vanderplanki TaxID=319348 RepID=A0A9J6BLM0_POLVA|nr:hypothetical protein PVAND_000642 [Polypedilum vanderplanki]
MKWFISIIFILSVFHFDLSSSQFSYRLPNNTKPEAYNIYLSFDDFADDKLIFNGEVDIKIKVLEESKSIILHEKVYNLFVNLTDENNSVIKTEIDYDSLHDFLIINLQNNETLKKNSYVNLKIGFVGKIRDDRQGLYRESYLDENLKTRYFLATHLQPTYARYVFPCYDEPKFKATFTLTVRHSNDYHAISNMDSASPPVVLPNNQVIKTFEKTPSMSTYVFALFISDFEAIEKIENGTIFRVFAREDQVNNTEFAIDTAIKALRHFEKEYDVVYGNNKLDQVSVPNLKSLGMENNFIIFNNDDIMFYEVGKTTNTYKEFTSQIVTHEVCHQFFGNQQTYEWWSYLWVAEGFCRYFEYHMTDKFYPEMRLKERFVVENVHTIFHLDSLNSRTVTSYVESPEEIKSVFDWISYTKAASIIKMFSHAFTEEKFNNALKNYLKTENGVVTSKDLYNALQTELPDVNIAEIFGSWELQSGFPVLFVERSYNNYRVRFSQKAFTNNFDKTSSQLWHIPITYSTPNGTISNFWINKKNQIEIPMDDLSSKQYLLVNVDQTGYYRVNYDDANWMLLAKELNSENFENFSPNTRAMLIDDAGTFSKELNIKITLFLELIKYLENEIDLIPWIVAERHLKGLRTLLLESDVFEAFNKFLQTLVTKSYSATKIEDETSLKHDEVHMSVIAINLACKAHLLDCLSQTRQIYEKIISDEEYSISVNFKETILCNGVINGNQTDFDFLWRLFETSNNKVEKVEIINAISCMEDENILMDFIKKYKELDDLYWKSIIKAFYERKTTGLKVLKNFLKEESAEFKKFILDGNHEAFLTKILREIAYATTTMDHYYELQTLMEIYNSSDNENVTISTIVNKNFKLLTRNVPEIKYFLRHYSNSGSKFDLSWMILVISWLIQYLVKI